MPSYEYAIVFEPAAPPRQSQPPSQPPSKPPSQPPSKPSQYKIDNIKPIPIQPNQRQTPLQNIGDSARPPSTQPAKYQEEASLQNNKKKQASKITRRSIPAI